ncbi:MAG: hypothetical protein AAB610_03005 [Patescibacteria group bacterium]
MNETTPKYIIELKNELKNNITGLKQEFGELKTTLVNRIDKMDVKINKMDVKMDEIIEKQDIHFETIGELKVQVTGIELNLKNKANHDYVKEIEKRTDKLEKVVFA